MFSGFEQVLEVGAGDGFGSKICQLRWPFDLLEGGVQSLAIFWRGPTFGWAVVTPQRDSRGNTKEIYRKYEGNIKEIQRKYKGNTKAILRKH